MTRQILATCACAVVLSAHLLDAQDRSRYRDFQLGRDLLSVEKGTGVAPSEAKIIHQRPAVMQELEWRPRYFLSGSTPQTDPVQQSGARAWSSAFRADTGDDDGSAALNVMFRRITTVRRGPASDLAAAWAHYPTIDAARVGASALLREDRVLRVMQQG